MKTPTVKTLATHPELVRAWLLAQAGMPVPALRPNGTGTVSPEPSQPVRH